jgi:integral membrane protein (TIGR00529 family)
MEAIFNIPVIVKITTIFIFILILTRRKHSLGTALLAGSLLLGFWCRMNVLQIAKSMGMTIIQTKTIMLNAIVILILILSHSMDKLGQMKRLLASFQGLVKNAKLNLVAFPAIIGLLPMPGGAIFSAPMVDVLGREHQLDPETKSLINYWFRHVWETAWPLYPGLLLAASLASVEVWLLAGIALPMPIVSILAGYTFLLRKISWKPTHHEQVHVSQILPFLKEMTPIILVIVGAVTGSVVMTWLQPRISSLAYLPTEMPLIVSLVVSIAAVLGMNHAPSDVIAAIFVNKALLQLAYMVTAIYIFKGVLVDSHAVVEVSEFLAALNIPLVPVIIILPAIVGVITGISVAFVGTTFPVLISLLQTSHIETSIIPYLILAYVSGFIGMMFSPIHVCLIFTREYFRSDFRLLYRRLWKPLFALFAGVFIYFSILIFFGI